MNWIKDMNEALEYIEANLEDSISSEDVARKAHISKFHFLRIFNILTGLTLGEYIRKRRLSLAVREVVSTKRKIIDIALKYGYETPEAFTKAFKRLHNMSPSEARKTKKNLNAFMPLSFQIIVRGEEKMNYRIVKKEQFKVAGIKTHVTNNNDENFKIIPEFWNKIQEDGSCSILEKNKGKLGVMGICYNFDMESNEFDYIVAIEGDNIHGLENYDVLNIKSNTFAIFESIGPMPNAIQSVWKRIFAEWFPATKYELADGPELEIYYPGDPSSSQYKSEVWIPIIDKE